MFTGLKQGLDVLPYFCPVLPDLNVDIEVCARCCVMFLQGLSSFTLQPMCCFSRRIVVEKEHLWADLVDQSQRDGNKAERERERASKSVREREHVRERERE